MLHHLILLLLASRSNFISMTKLFTKSYHKIAFGSPEVLSSLFLVYVMI